MRNWEMRRKRLIWLAPVGILAVLGFIALGGFLVMQLWNWLLPALLGWHALTFWQGLALLALCRILFGRIGGRGFGPRVGHRMRWAAMTPAERERFRQGLRGRCGFSPAASEPEAE